MNILLIGGTGHIGSNLLLVLAARGHQVTTIVRSQSRWKLPTTDINVVESDDVLPDPSLLPASLDWVIDAAAPYPLALFVPEETFDAAEQRTDGLLSLAHGYDAGFCYVSSFVTLPSRFSLHTAFKRRSSPYYVLKRRLESKVTAAMKRGRKGLVINPGACLGPGDRRPYQECVLARLANDDLPATTGKLTCVVDVRDVAREALDLLERGGASKPVPMLGHLISAGELAARVARITGAVAPADLKIPGPLLTAGAMAIETAATTLSLETPINALALMLMTERVDHIDPGSFRPLTPLDKTIRDSLAWYRQATLNRQA